MKRVTVTIPATSANLGPGFDCLGVALNLHHTVSFTAMNTPGITITAHTSAVSFVEDIAPLFLANLGRYLAGEQPHHLVDFTRGY